MPHCTPYKHVNIWYGIRCITCFVKCHPFLYNGLLFCLPNDISPSLLVYGIYVPRKPLIYYSLVFILYWHLWPLLLTWFNSTQLNSTQRCLFPEIYSIDQLQHGTETHTGLFVPLLLSSKSSILLPLCLTPTGKYMCTHTKHSAWQVFQEKNRSFHTCELQT